MALHPNFPANPHAILDPAIRWFPADEVLRTTSLKSFASKPTRSTTRPARGKRLSP